MINIAIIDDHIATRRGIQSIMPRNIKLVYESDNIEDLIKHYKSTAPDVVVLDMNLKTTHGIDTVHQLLEKLPEARILVYSMLDGIPGVSACYDANAKGFVSKGSPVEYLIEAIKQIASTAENYYEPDIKEALLDYHFDLNQHDPRNLLTKSELEVFKYFSLGKTFSETAELMSIAEKTVHNRSYRITKSLNIKRHQFADYARKYNIIY